MWHDFRVLAYRNEVSKVPLHEVLFNRKLAELIDERPDFFLTSVRQLHCIQDTLEVIVCEILDRDSCNRLNVPV